MFAWLQAFDGAIGAALPQWARLAVYGLIVGAIAMVIYWRISPQKRLVTLKAEMRDAQRELKAYRGTDGKEVLRLSQRAVSLAGKQVLMVVGPTVIAMLPVVLMVVGLEHISPPAVSWLKSWEVPFMTGLTISALVMKFALKIV